MRILFLHVKALSFAALLLILTSGAGPEAARAQETEGASFYDRLAAAALERTRHSIRYVADYVVIDYPGGDVPEGTGVCSDVVIRAYRALGIDLQRLVHEDMRAHFSAYPKNWGLTRPDRNIDHRRVPNLQRFLERRGAGLTVTDSAAAYLPGDVVAWDLNGKGLTHIGIVVPGPDGATGEGWIVHNIGAGPKRERRLFEWTILGHYRFGAELEAPPVAVAE